MIVSIGEFKGKPVLTFKRTEDDKFPFSIGVRKAQVVLQHVQEIQSFYESNKHTLKSKSEGEGA
jgi:hypothetical protein